MRTSNRVQQWPIALLLTLLVACSASRPAPATLSGDTRVHDPSLIRSGQSYYVFSTGDERGLNDGTIQIRRSADMAHWELVGTVFEHIPAWVAKALGSTPPNLWAPDISYTGGVYRLYYAGSTFGSNHSVIGLATNTTLDPADPAYQWVDQGMVIESHRADNWNAIDPSLASDRDGGQWLVFGSFWDGIKMRRLDSATGKLAADDTQLYALASRQGGAIEAPAILRHGDWYYLFVSFDLCCRGVNSTYNIRVGRSDSIGGPYVDRSGAPMLRGGGELLLKGDERLRGPGGQSVYVDGGSELLVNHVYVVFKNGMPQLQIHALSWTRDGWPEVRPA
jgi:arabinan endo-1,5-alpha-L-arabinosidase